MTPTQRTTSWLKEQGYLVGTVERFIHPSSFSGTGYRKDLFGCIDMIAIKTGEVVAVQSTGTDWSGHWKKLTVGSGRSGLEAWLDTGQPFLLIGWRKLKAGWQPRIHWFQPADLPPIPPSP